ncbi:hypothetical protein AB3N04_00015 (plasmid) [Alkalihalophilus sp. As8PL]|uniref:Uncharacterized protein n=1 Tax=Alkalihalophilus sp. As8PL TaxID=3237103 RepID=A0AB39BNH2_9BACI
MNWIEIISNIGFVTVGSVSIIGLISYLVKLMLSSWLERKLDTHRNKLEKETERYRMQIDKELQIHRLELEKGAYEHQINYSKLHNDRAEAIKILYVKLTQVHESMKELFNIFQMNGDTPKQEKAKSAATNYNELIKFYLENLIYFDQETCRLFEAIRDSYKELYDEFTNYDIHITHNTDDIATSQEKRKIWIDCWKSIKNDIPPLQDKLVDEFRRLLGVQQ